VRDRREVLRQIACEEDKLAALTKEIENQRDLIASLKAELSRSQSEISEPRRELEDGGAAIILSNAESVR